MNFAGDGPDARPEVVESGVLDSEPVRQVSRVGERRAQAHEPHLLPQQQERYERGGGNQAWVGGSTGTPLLSHVHELIALFIYCQEMCDSLELSLRIYVYVHSFYACYFFPGVFFHSRCVLFSFLVALNAGGIAFANHRASYYMFATQRTNY